VAAAADTGPPLIRRECDGNRYRLFLYDPHGRVGADGEGPPRDGQAAPGGRGRQPSPRWELESQLRELVCFTERDSVTQRGAGQVEDAYRRSLRGDRGGEGGSAPRPAFGQRARREVLESSKTCLDQQARGARMVTWPRASMRRDHAMMQA